MLSKRCDFKDFIQSLPPDCNKLDLMICLEREATEAERMLYRRLSSDADRKRCGKDYATALKECFFYLRNGRRPSHVSPDDFEMFCGLCTRLMDAPTQRDPEYTPRSHPGPFRLTTFPEHTAGAERFAE